MKFKLDESSLNKITNGAHQIMVYGFKDCLYEKVERAIIALGLEAQSWSYQSFETIDYDEIELHQKNGWLTCARKCKSILTSLFIENFKRSLEGKPIIPLLFCVEKKDSNGISKVDLKKLAHTRNFPGCITDEELRRAYKIYAEAAPEFKKIILETLKFVRVKQNESNPELYELELLEPYWQNPEWKNLWDERQDLKKQGDKFYFFKYLPLVSFWNDVGVLFKTIEPGLISEKPEKKHPWREVLNDVFSNGEFNPFTGKRNRFFYTNPEINTSDEEMVKSAFGKGSTIARKLSR